jgi:ubiquitin C-terminal hydrolase
MWSNEGSNIISPIELLKCFQRECIKSEYYFSNFSQNDVDEFLTLFLDLLHKSISRKVKITYNKTVMDEGDKIIVKSLDTWKRFYENDYSYIVENFHSQLLSLTTCPMCEYYTSNHDPIQVISLEIPENGESFKDCFKKYTDRFVLDDDNLWECDRCKEKVKSEKKLMLWKTSDILIILLKRYKNGQKNNKYIEYPLILSLNKFNMNYGTKKKNSYSLQSFAVHDGGLGGGHYYAICKNPLDKKWREYNDSNVTLIDNDDVKGYVPYLFFYKRL